MTQQDRNSQWNDKFQQLKSYQIAHGHLDVKVKDDKKLYCWISNQRLKHKQGTLSPERLGKLMLLGVKLQLPEERKRKNASHGDDHGVYHNDRSFAQGPTKIATDSSRVKVRCVTPTVDQDFGAAECLMFMSRGKDGQDDASTNEPEQVVSFSKEAGSFMAPFCEACKGDRHRSHHQLCPKSSNFNRVKLEKILQGASVGCILCEKQLETGIMKKHDRHSNLCCRSRDYEAATLPTKKVTTMKTKYIPNSLFLPSMPCLPATVQEPFVPPLITVDTFDFDALIHDLEKGDVDADETLERLQKIRRLAY